MSHECPKCGKNVPKLLDVYKTDYFEDDRVCGHCIKKYSMWAGREGQKTIGQERHEEIQSEYDRCGSGWPQ